MSTADRPPMLTSQLLDGLLASLTRAGFPTQQRLRPGLTDEQMDELTAPLGLSLPAEARVWWSRHNGAEGDAPVGPPHFFASLEEMAADALQLRALHHDAFNEDGVVLWDDRLMPLVLSETCFGCDCSVAPGDASPIWLWIPKDAEDLRGPLLPSLGALVDIRITAVDEGLYEYLPERGRPLDHTDQLKPGRWPDGLP